MNIKKMFTALSAMVVAVTMMLPSASVLGATYSAELEGAYNWAYSKGVTTMPSIDSANMYGAMTRAEMAKMISVYAIEVLGMTPDTARACNFSDIDSVKGDLHDYIIKSCQLGIMGQGITAFRPYDTLPRAEFGTALSRLLWGNKYDGATPYYVNHLNALKAAGIMNNIANAESTKEVRGYVMLMLQRSEALAGGSSSSTKCNDPVVKVACSMDTDACPAECKGAEVDEDTTVVKAGDLAVTATAAAGRKAIKNAVSDLDTLKFKTSEKVEITKVVLERYGYSSRTDITNVWLEDENGNIISSEGTVGTKDQVSLSIKKEYRSVDGVLNATVVVKLPAVVTGSTLWFKVVSAESTAENLNLDDYSPYEYEIVAYTAVSDVTIDAKGSDRTYNYEEGEMYEVAKMKINNRSATAINVNGFTLVNAAASPKLDLGDFVDEVEVTVDGDAVKAEWSVNKAWDLNVSFNKEVAIEAKANAVFAVSASLVDFDEYGDNVKLTLTGADFKATEKKTGVRVTPTVGGVWASYKFAGSKIKLSNSKVGNVEYGQGSTDVVVAEWKITVAEGVESINANGTFVVTGTYSNTWDVIMEMRLLVAGEEYLATKTPNGTNSGATFTFPTNMEIEKSGKFQVVVDLNTDNEAPAGTVVTFEGSFDDAAFSGAKYYDKKWDVKPDEVSGVISFAKKLTVQAWKASFTNSLTKSVEFLNNDTDVKTVFDGTYTAKKTDVNLTEFRIDGSSILSGTTATFYLYVDGKNVADIRLNSSKLTWDDQISKVTIPAGESASIRVDAELSVKNFTGSFGKFAVTLNGEDDNNNAITTTPKNTVEVKAVDAESVKISDGAARAKDILLKGSEATLAQFIVKSSNGGNVKFSEFAFSGTYGVGSGYAADDLVVTLGKTELDCAGTAWSKITCEVDDVTLDGNGDTVKIALADSDKADWDVELTVWSLNTEDLTTPKKFNKRFLPAVVRVASQEWKAATTIFTFDVDLYEDEADPVWLGIYTKSWTNCNGIVYENTGFVLEDGKTLTLTNGSTAAMICAVKYGKNLGTGTVEVTTISEEDYFKLIPTTDRNGKTSNDDLMVATVSTN